MTDLHSLQARAGDLERAIAETDDRHGSLLSGLESGLSALRERLVEAKLTNDRLERENVELRTIAEQLLDGLENRPAETLHDKLAALDGQIHGLLELSGGQVPVNGTPVAITDDSVASKAAPESGGDASGPFGEIRERMRALSSQLLAPATAALAPEPAPDQTPASIRLPDTGPPPKPAPEQHARRNLESPRAFDRPIRALAEKAQNVLPKAHLRFDAETDYALTILRRIKGVRQSFSTEEVRELINGKFGLCLTQRDDVQLSASMSNQDGVARGARGTSATAAQSWRFEMG